MPNTGAWKQFERKVCGMLGGRRTPLSGAASGHHTHGDCIELDMRVYPEAKWISASTAGGSALTIWDDTVKKAKAEGKLPLLAMHRRGSRVEFGAIPLITVTQLLHNAIEARNVLEAILDDRDDDGARMTAGRLLEVLRKEVTW